MASLTKLAAAALTAVALNSTTAMAAQMQTPLVTEREAAPTQNVQMGRSVPLKRIKHDRVLTHAETVAQRKQLATHEAMVAKQQNSWSFAIGKYFGLAGAVINEAGIKMPNTLDVTYAMPIYVTKAVTEMHAVLDTAMSDVVLETDACTTCGTTKLAVAGPPAGMTIGTTAVEGTFNNSESTYSGTDGTVTFCISKADGQTAAQTAISPLPELSNIAGKPCILDTKVHLANVVKTPNAAATAYLGLALGKGADKNGKTPAAGTLIMDQLVSGSKLDATSKKLAIVMKTDDGDDSVLATSNSYVDFGASTTTDTKAGTTKAAIQFNTDDYYWKTSLKGFKFGTRESGIWGLESETITVETGKQCLYVPSDYYEFMIESLAFYSTGMYYTTAGDVIVDCADVANMETISLLMNDKWVELIQTDYITPVRTTFDSKERSTGMCKLCVKTSWDGDWHVGIAALVGYYAEFDFEKSTLTLQPQATSTKVDVLTGGTPERVLGVNVVTVSLLITGLSVIFLLFVFLCIATNTDIFNPGRASNKKSSSSVEAESSTSLTLSELEVLLQNAINNKTSSDQQSLSLNALV